MVNNVGGGPGFFLAQNPEEYARIIERNLLSTAFGIRAAADCFIRTHRPGAIINITSESRRLAYTSPVYSACKAGVEALTRTTANELAPYKIRVNAVSAGIIATGEAVRVLREPQKAPKAAQIITDGVMRSGLKRPANPEEVGDIVALLASEVASFVTGATWSVAGGLY